MRALHEGGPIPRVCECGRIHYGDEDEYGENDDDYEDIEGDDDDDDDDFDYNDEDVVVRSGSSGRREINDDEMEEIVRRMESSQLKSLGGKGGKAGGMAGSNQKQHKKQQQPIPSTQKTSAASAATNIPPTNAKTAEDPLNLVSKAQSAMSKAAKKEESSKGKAKVEPVINHDNSDYFKPMETTVKVKKATTAKNDGPSNATSKTSNNGSGLARGFFESLNTSTPNPPFTSTNAKSAKGNKKLTPKDFPWINIHPQDNISSINPAVLEDPAKFVPRVNPRAKRVLNWGVNEDEGQEGEGNPFLLMLRPQTVQTLYGHLSSDKQRFPESPEIQFSKRLIAKKQKQLSDRLSNPPIDPQCDFVIRISMVSPENYDDAIIWRLVKVASSIKLHIMHDKVLAPALGFVRHYHGYLITDFKDGALFGPEGSDAIDMVWGQAFKFIDSVTTTLGSLMWKVGDEIGYEYDLGDHFMHKITLERVIPASESDGRVELMDGQGACPPEDSNGFENHKGSLGYAELMDDWDSMSKKDKKKVVTAVLGSANYHGEKSFDPKVFDLKAAKKRVAEAIRSKTSQVGGTKKVIHQLRFDVDAEEAIVGRGKLQEDEFINKVETNDGTNFTEKLTTRADDWKAFHKPECKSMKEDD
ncbi:hypothetical protein HDU76_005653 [Blyttiomyces sp. JEL0837]|nr:hypothetical protein HDU76_005653 [Blyttiomyces sp. JEL0837]